MTKREKCDTWNELTKLVSNDDHWGRALHPTLIGPGESLFSSFFNYFTKKYAHVLYQVFWNIQIIVFKKMP